MLSIGILLIIVSILSIIINKKNTIFILISLELLLLGISLLFIWASLLFDEINGIITALFILTIGAAESAIGLSLLIKSYAIKK